MPGDRLGIIHVVVDHLVKFVAVNLLVVRLVGPFVIGRYLPRVLSACASEKCVGVEQWQLSL